MLNQLQDLLNHLNSQPNASDGFPAGMLYVEGMKYGMTCKEVKETFLGKEKALTRGLYPAAVTAEVLEASKNAPAKPVKAARSPKAKPTRNVSTLVLEKVIVKTTAETEARKALIAGIAKRHASEDRTIDELTASSNKPDEGFISEEYVDIMKSGVALPELSVN